jgi:general secretion pathway protein C
MVVLTMKEARQGEARPPQFYREPLHDNRPMPFSTSSLAIWRLRLVSALLAALAGLSLGFWGLRWWAGRPTPLAESVVFAEPAQADAQTLARWLGATGAAPDAKAPAAASAFSLLGVVAQADGASGLALLAVQGQPARHFRVGDTVHETWRLQTLAARSAELLDTASGARLSLQLPPLSVSAPTPTPDAAVGKRP